MSINGDVYNTDSKKITFALSFMTKEAALSWAATFHYSTISGSIINIGTFTDFVLKFETSFKHYDITGNAVTWLSTKWMTKLKGRDRAYRYEPSLTHYTSNFQNYIAQAQVTDNNVLIGYYFAGIPPELMCCITYMDIIPSTINEWYKKATHFQTQKNHADEIIKWNSKPLHTYTLFFQSPTTKTQDLDAMDIDIIKVAKITPGEQKWCIEKELCFHCQKSGHLSSTCPIFSSSKPRKVQIVKETEKKLPRLQEIDNKEKEEMVRRIPFTPLDF